MRAWVERFLRDHREWTLERWRASAEELGRVRRDGGTHDELVQAVVHRNRAHDSLMRADRWLDRWTGRR